MTDTSRFPGFGVLEQAGHWDPVTAGVVLSRIVPRIDTRLAEQATDGWRYAEMPEDGQAWRVPCGSSTRTGRVARVEPVDAVSMHGVLRPPVGVE